MVIKFFRILKRLIKTTILHFKKWQILRKYPYSSPGTLEWLVGKEIKYGGIIVNVPRNKVSPLDYRTEQELRTGGMVGGDRMLHHGYAKKYSQYLLPFVQKEQPVVLAEFGILKGTGLAIWCDLFQNGKILGLDIDLEHFNKNMDNLKKLGAFRNNVPELYEYDQLVENAVYIGAILDGDMINICIDDGFHSSESIIKTINSVKPYLADDFVYFIEDNSHVHREIRSLYPEFKVDNQGELTVISPKS